MAKLIESIRWGQIEVNDKGVKKIYKDMKISPNIVEEWDWNVNKTRHNPGIQIADVVDLIGNDDHLRKKDQIDTFILTRGMERKLQVMPDTIKFLDDKGINIIIMETSDAVKTYNMMTNHGYKVAGLFHSTC